MNKLSNWEREGMFKYFQIVSANKKSSEFSIKIHILHILTIALQLVIASEMKAQLFALRSPLSALRSPLSALRSPLSALR